MRLLVVRSCATCSLPALLQHAQAPVAKRQPRLQQVLALASRAQRALEWYLEAAPVAAPVMPQALVHWHTPLVLARRVKT
jgi:hypothetical protein